MDNSLLDLFLDDYNVIAHVVVYANGLDKNGKQAISNEVTINGRFFETGSLQQNGNIEAFLTNAELYVPCDIDPKQRVVTSGYVEIDNHKYDIVRVQKADIFDGIDFTRIWLR